MGQMPTLKRSDIFVLSAPPDQEMRSFPSNSFVKRRAALAVRGKRDLPDMYISSPDMMSPGLSTGRVFVSFTPNESPAFSAAA